jgi:hypothetical protein
MSRTRVTLELTHATELAQENETEGVRTLYRILSHLDSFPSAAVSAVCPSHLSCCSGYLTIDQW